VLPFATMHDELLIFNTRVRRDGQVQESLTFAGTIGYKKNSLSLSARTHASKLDSTGVGVSLRSVQYVGGSGNHPRIWAFVFFFFFEVLLNDRHESTRVSRDSIGRR
jgi:hypothetical protein